MQLHAATDLTDKVAALSCADFYDDHDGISCIETHMSWVFLTPRYAYKLKKPVRSTFLDFSTLAARERYCREELRLNRRLAPSVYLDVVPLRRKGGRFLLDGGQRQLDSERRGESGENGESGEIVDYLVKMVRLPAALMLDRALAAHSLRRGDLRAVMATLVKFYRDTERAPLTPAQYCARFSTAIEDNRAQLSAPRYGLPPARIERIAAAQRDYVAASAELAARAARVVDAHGDLRPEHIFLGTAHPAAASATAAAARQPLQIIDCLEFQSELRRLDPVDELSFLALECTRLGAPPVGRALLRLYRRMSGDLISSSLIAFYQSHRAMVRAVLAIWHLDDPAVRDRERWHQRALTYLDMAEHAIARAWPIGIAGRKDDR